MLEAISIDRPSEEVFRFVANRYTLPRWTKAFKAASAAGADYETPQGIVPIRLDVAAAPDVGVIDWAMMFPDGVIERAYARVIAETPQRANVQFFFAPPLPPEKTREIVAFFSAVIRNELAGLKCLLENPAV